MAVLALAVATRVCADPVAEMAGFSIFKEVDLAKLAKGEVMTARGPAMSSPRELSVQACYVVTAPLQKTVDLHAHWNPVKHPEMKVYLHGDLPAKPSPADFQKIASAPNNSSVRALVEATEALNTGPLKLQMTHAEAKLFSKSNEKGLSGALGAAWGNLLCQRADAFAAGGLSRQPPYELAGETVRPAEEMTQLMKDQPKIRGQFSGLIERLSSTPSDSLPYWELSDVDGEAALSLGAFLTKRGDAFCQAVDAQYYNSGGYYILLTFYQMWPVKIGAQEATLVWRGDLVSAASLGELHGVEKVAAGNVMTKEIKKTVGIFLKDVSTTR